MKDEIKLTFKLSEEQMGPFPISSESLWFIKEVKGYRLKNIPFFIDELSFDDVIQVKQRDDELYILEQVLIPSGNSTIWIYLKDLKVSQCIVEKIIKMGCGIESGVIGDYYAINIPKDVDYSLVHKLVAQEEDNNCLIADYPSTRHY